MKADISVKITKVTAHGDSDTDIEMALEMDGKPLGIMSVRVNRMGKQAEETALGMGQAEAERLAGELPAPVPSKRTKP